MLLTPTEMERLVIYTAAELARKRRAKGLRLNYPETVALISDEVLEGAREGRTVAEMMSIGSRILTHDDVMPGVPAMLPILQVEATFPDGTKLVTIHEPLRPAADGRTDEAEPGGYIIAGEGDIEINAGRPKVTLIVVNTGDRPVQVGSHYHFFEANKALEFDREASFGMRLDIPAGTAVRIEPGQQKKVTLTTFGGHQVIGGYNNLTNGDVNDPAVRQAALLKARASGYRGA